MLAPAGRANSIYWRERDQEVDFVVRSGRRLMAIQVKSGRAPQVLPGIKAFNAAFKPGGSCSSAVTGFPCGNSCRHP